MTKVKELMTSQPVFVSKEASLQSAAQKMRHVDCGVLPVGSERHVIGIITDRDITIRAVANGVDMLRATVQDYMTEATYSCHEGDTLAKAADQMRRHQVSRLLVKDDSGRVSGILSFGCILRKDADAEEIGRVIEHAVGRKAA